MKHYIYEIFDKVAEAFTPKIMKEAPEEVISNHQRAIKVAIRKEDYKTLEMFEDKVILLAGSIDDENGLVKCVGDKPIEVIDLDALVKPVLEATVKHD